MKIFKFISKTFFVIMLMHLSYQLDGQSTKIGVTFSNNITGLPVLSYPKLFYSQFHPGLDAFMAWKLNKSEKNLISANGNLGFYHHQFVQTLIRVYPSIRYDRVINQRLNLGIGLGGGYGLSFEGDRAFILQDDGHYEPKAFFGARSQYLIAFNIGGSYALIKDKPDLKILIRFNSFMQGTYVKSYVALLPINSFNFGLQFPLNKNHHEN